jgi:hypothetical protein
MQIKSEVEAYTAVVVEVDNSGDYAMRYEKKLEI